MVAIKREFPFLSNANWSHLTSYNRLSSPGCEKQWFFFTSELDVPHTCRFSLGSSAQHAWAGLRIPWTAFPDGNEQTQYKADQ